MKDKVYTLKLCAICILFIAGMSLQACKDHNNDDAEPTNEEIMAASWTATSIRQDGMDVTSEYPDFTLKLNADHTYSSSGAKKLLYPSGSWSAIGSEIPAAGISLDNSTAISLTWTADKQSFTAEFIVNEGNVNMDGRAAAVLGDYVVIFKK